MELGVRLAVGRNPDGCDVLAEASLPKFGRGNEASHEGHLVHRVSPYEVRPKIFRILARITEDDDKEFQGATGRCSKWLSTPPQEHRGQLRVAPDVEEMEAELALVRAWHDRVRNYANN